MAELNTKNFDWITGYNETIEHRRFIASGGGGEVHEVCVFQKSGSFEMFDANNGQVYKK